RSPSSSSASNRSAETTPRSGRRCARPCCTRSPTTSASTMPGCMSSGTEGRSRCGRLVLWRTAVLLPAALLGFSLARAATPSGLRALLEKAESTLEQTEKAVRSGKDPGKVSLLLQRLDEELVSFQEASGLEGLAKAFEDGRAAARGSDMEGAAAAVRKASGMMAAVTDYVVLREAAGADGLVPRAAGGQ